MCRERSIVWCQRFGRTKWALGWMGSVMESLGRAGRGSAIPFRTPSTARDYLDTIKNVEPACVLGGGGGIQKRKLGSVGEEWKIHED